MASKGMPSLLALLGLVAVAGYQNRDKLRDMIGDARTGGGAPAPAGAGAPAPGGGLLDEIGRMFGGGSDDGASEASGRNLKEGLDSLLDRFRTAGQGAKADSWVSPGENSGLAEDELETAIGSDTLDELAQKTGLSRAEIAKRLATALPATVHRLTPEGRIPSESEARNLI